MTTPEPPATLADLVNPRTNTLNFVRLLLAASVIVWHAYPLSGNEFPVPWLAGHSGGFAGGFGVDGFFAISGYLLAGSWLHRPRLLDYLRNRALRIMPAFWVCLIVVGFGFAPLAALAAGGSASDVLTGEHSAGRYVLVNSLLSIEFHDVAGTPAEVALPGVWNGSLWTLRWEAAAYLCLAALGLLGLLRRRIVPLVLLAGLWLVRVGLAGDVIADGYWISNGSRLGFMFLTGSVLHLWADRISVRPWVPVVAAGLVLVSPVLVDYRILGGVALAYLVLWLGGVNTRRALRLQDRDISYGLYIYAFPIHQSLMLAGGDRLPPLLMALVTTALTVPLATASWVLVERPALRLKKRRAPRPVPEVAFEGVDAVAGQVGLAMPGISPDGGTPSTRPPTLPR